MTCPLGQCDGSGMLDVYSLHTVTRNPNGSVFKKKERLTREQYDRLIKVVDWDTQTLHTAALPCGCKSMVAQ